MGNENLHHLLLKIKSWLHDTCVEYDGAYKFMNMTNFLTSKFIIIEKNNKFIEGRGLFEKDLNLNF
jgi:hypothetical protein